MNWKHASFALALFSGLGLISGCEKHQEAPGCYELSVAWADGTPCADADVRWLGQGDWNGQWSEGFEEILLSPFQPVDNRSQTTWCSSVDAPPLHAIEVRYRSDTTLHCHVLITNESQRTFHATLPKPIHVRLLPGKTFPSWWIGRNTEVWADSMGWMQLGSVDWTQGGSSIGVIASTRTLEIWMDLPTDEANGVLRQKRQIDLNQEGPWPDSLDWMISVP